MICSTCRLWHELEAPSGPQIVGERFGQCRLAPHVVLLPDPQTRSFIPQTLYPLTTPDFPACAFHQAIPESPPVGLHGNNPPEFSGPRLLVPE